MRQYLSYGSLVGVLVLAGLVLPFTYIQRGIVLTQKSVVRVVEETPPPELPEADEQPDGSKFGYQEPPARAPPQLTIEPALVTIPLGGKWQKRQERQSLLG